MVSRSANPTNGYVSYVDQASAQNEGLISTSNGSIYMGVGSTNVASGSGCATVRVASKNTYNHGPIILGLAHMPSGTWLTL
jgi:surface antigen